MDRPRRLHSTDLRRPTGLRAVDLILSYQFEEEIGAASSENGLFIAKM
jgi:hypothetical protein